MRPFFPYYGSKWRQAHRHPPRHDVIVEPFAGSAKYSTVWGRGKRCVLVDKYDVICAIWDYLIHVSPDEIRSIPDAVHVDNLDAWPSEVRWLAGFWMNHGSVSPRNSVSGFVKAKPYQGWSHRTRSRIANQVDWIRKWEVIQGDYTDAPDMNATWHVDPPYIDKGSRYVHSSAQIDYAHLAAWCRSRRGYVMVHEQRGAEWMNFRADGDYKSATGKSAEVVWTSHPDAQSALV